LTSDLKSEKLDSSEKVTQELYNYPDYAKIWVCGPPAMNEVFEKIPDLKNGQKRFHIL